MVRPFSILLALLLGSSLIVLPGCGGHTGLAPVSKQGRSTAPRNVSFHKVRRGETLYSIAFQHGKDFRKLARLNRIRSPHTIYVGQKIWLKSSKKRHASHSRTAKKRQVRKKTSKSTLNKPSNKLKKKKKTVKRVAKKSSNQGYTKGPIRWQWPANGLIINKFSKKSSTKKGIDIAGKSGQAIKATAAGKIVYSGSGLRGYGRLIIVQHNERFLSAYAHNRKLLVKEGQQVKQGQRIAEMGRSGTDRVKLHFEIRSDGNPVDPLRYLPRRR